MARPPKPEELRRDKMLPIRLTQDEWKELLRAAKRHRISVSDLLREGAKLLIQTRDKDGSPKREEKRR